MKREIENVINSDYLRVLFVWILLSVCVISAFIYCGYIALSISQAFESKQLVSEIGKLQLHLNNLESQYLSLQKEITISRAQNLGFVEVSGRYFISRQRLSQALTLRDEL